MITIQIRVVLAGVEEVVIGGRLSGGCGFPLDPGYCYSDVHCHTFSLNLTFLCSSVCTYVIFNNKSEVKVAQSCPTPCDPMDYTVHGILQARTLEG